MEDMAEGKKGGWEVRSGLESFFFSRFADVLERWRSPLNSKKEHSEFRFLLFVVLLLVIGTFWETKKKNRSCPKKKVYNLYSVCFPRNIQNYV